MDNSLEEIIKKFDRINQIPRCSKNEDRIADYLENWAKENNFKVKRDSVNNIRIDVPASADFEDPTTFIIQGHMDMVCEKSPESGHDFAKDPIKSYREEGWLTADKTTLGADNGIALALGMELATSDEISHPPLALLFTVDEETGLTGAKALKKDFLQGEYLINLDSETEGVFTVGCAGGEEVDLSKDYDLEENSCKNSFKIKIDGLKGGHSGIDINRNRLNASKVAITVLEHLKKIINFNLSEFSGGTAHNAIPRSAYAVISTNFDSDKIKPKLSQIENNLKTKYSSYEPNLSLSLEKTEKQNQFLSKEKTDHFINFLDKMPHGVFTMSEMEGLVQSSDNLAIVNLEDGKMKIKISMRSSDIDVMNKLSEKINSIADNFDVNLEKGGKYPAWKPNFESDFLKKCLDVYNSLFQNKAKIEVIHAGLETGVIGSKRDRLDMISIGPTIEDPHSPDEKIHIESIQKIWLFLKTLFESYK